MKVAIKSNDRFRIYLPLVLDPEALRSGNYSACISQALASQTGDIGQNDFRIQSNAYNASNGPSQGRPFSNDINIMKIIIDLSKYSNNYCRCT